MNYYKFPYIKWLVATLCYQSVYTMNYYELPYTKWLVATLAIDN